MSHRFIIALIIFFVSCKTKQVQLHRKEGPDRVVEINEGYTLPPKPVLSGKPIPKFIPLSEFSGDTVAFIKANFIAGKERYINKPFKQFLNDLNIPLKRFVTGTAGNHLEYSPNMYVHIYTPTEEEIKEKKHQDPVILIISWAEPLPEAEVLALIKSTHGKWTKEAEAYYSDKIIGNIKIFPF